MSRRVPVLIVGAGPAGLTAAATLSRYGIEFLLVERRAELSSLPRATAASVRSMELMRLFGIEDEIRAGSADVEWHQLRCQTLAQAHEGIAISSGYPTRDQSAVVSPCAPACVPQDHLEPVLLEHIRSRGVGQVELGVEVTALESAAGGVRAKLSDSRVIEADYLVAADGAHSRMRSALGIQMVGPDRLLDAVSAQFRAPAWELVGDQRFVLYAITHPEADGVFLPCGRDDRWLYGVPFLPNAENLGEEDMRRRIKIGLGVPGIEPVIERIGSFQFAAQVAESYRSDNAFLVGDAAHRATPRGGTGMNTGIHDGFDIGWKLAWVLNGWAGPELLDSYERERRPVAEHNVCRSAEQQQAGDPGDQLHADIGGRMTHAWTMRDGQRVSTLDLLGPGLTLFTGPDPVTTPAMHDRLPLSVQQLDAISARALGLHADSGLLVRPDGAPTGLAAEDLRLAA